jgi:hypothetical protein
MRLPAYLRNPSTAVLARRRRGRCRARVVGDEPGGGVQADRDRPVVGGCLSRAGESGCRTGASTTAATVAKRRGHRRCMIAASGGG